MATGGPDKRKQRKWSLNDKFKVYVTRDSHVYISANVELQCFATENPNAEFKWDVQARKTIVQFPVQVESDSRSRDRVKETFRKCVVHFVTKNLNFVLIPIDDIRYWTKREFCEVILEEFTELAGNQKAELNHPVKLEFCTMEAHNFREAVKACEAKIRDVKSEQVVQKNRKSLSICIVEDSLANVKVDAIVCTTAQDFDLSRGAVSAALLRQGGSGLQRELYKECGGAKNYGEVIPVSGHKLDCSVVFFGVMYPYDPKYAKGYKTVEEYYHISIHEFVQRCLNLAEKYQLRSVAFPAVGAGDLSYPLHIVADEMFRTIDNWQGTFVKEVKFVIYPKDTVVLYEFERALKKYGHSPFTYGQANETGHAWNSRFWTRSLNPSAGQTKRTMNYRKQLPTASDDKSGMKQKKVYLEKENEEKTAQTLGTGREDFILDDDDDDDDEMYQSSIAEWKTLTEKKDDDPWTKYHKDYSSKETYSRSNQTCPKCDIQKPDKIIGQRKSSNMSETSKEKSYEVKKVGKFWLLGRSGGTLKKCPLLTNAEEVDTSDNFIAADDQVYEIKEDEFEQVYLVSVEETPIYHHNNNNRKTNQTRQGESISPSLSQRRSRAWFKSHQQETLPQYAINLNEMKITDKSEIGKNADQYYLLEAGQTEDSSLIEVAFPAKQ